MRASFPNRDPELSIFPDGWVTEKTLWTPPKPPARNESFVTLESPMLHDKTMFQQYMVGVGGHCEHYTPPVSYWCSEHPSGGGAFSFRVPSGLTYPHLKDWKSPTKGGIVNAWRPAHWANWMFEIDQWDPATKTIGWSKGGFQGARGNDVGGEWYVENIFEELDNPNEYYYDEDTMMLYYAPNATTAEGQAVKGPPTGKFEAVVNQTIVKLVGTQEHPVEDVRLEGVTFRDSAYTYMEPHGTQTKTNTKPKLKPKPKPKQKRPTLSGWCQFLMETDHCLDRLGTNATKTHTESPGWLAGCVSSLCFVFFFCRHALQGSLRVVTGACNVWVRSISKAQRA